VLFSQEKVYEENAMPKVLVAYTTLAGHTEKMAQYIAEGVLFSGCEAVLKNINKITDAADLEGYDGYIFGSPTYHRDMPNNMKTFLFLCHKVNLEGKLGGAFGSYTHSGDAPTEIMETMEYVFKMEHFELSSFRLKEAVIDLPESAKACQDYGRTFGQKLL
jgi:flavorubredoxin